MGFVVLGNCLSLTLASYTMVAGGGGGPASIEPPAIPERELTNEEGNTLTDDKGNTIIIPV